MSDIITIQKGKISASVNTFGAELVSLKQDGAEYIWDADENVWEHHAPVLFPICGGLINNSLLHNGARYHLDKHGFANSSEFAVTRKLADELELSICSDAKTKESYPFDFVFSVIFRIIDTGLEVTYRVENTGNETMYYSLGAHEGFACRKASENMCIEFPKNVTLDTLFVTGPFLNGKSKRVVTDSNSLMLKSKYFEEDALIFKSIDFDSLKLVDTVTGKTVKCNFGDFRHLLIWTKPKADFVCVEPWNGMPDHIGFNDEFAKKDSVLSLEAGKTASFLHSFELEMPE